MCLKASTYLGLLRKVGRCSKVSAGITKTDPLSMQPAFSSIPSTPAQSKAFHAAASPGSQLSDDLEDLEALVSSYQEEIDPVYGLHPLVLAQLPEECKQQLLIAHQKVAPQMAAMPRSSPSPIGRGIKADPAPPTPKLQCSSHEATVVQPDDQPAVVAVGPLPREAEEAVKAPDFPSPPETGLIVSQVGGHDEGSSNRTHTLQHPGKAAAILSADALASLAQSPAQQFKQLETLPAAALKEASKAAAASPGCKQQEPSISESLPVPQESLEASFHGPCDAFEYVEESVNQHSSIQKRLPAAADSTQPDASGDMDSLPLNEPAQSSYSTANILSRLVDAKEEELLGGKCGFKSFSNQAPEDLLEGLIGQSSGTFEKPMLAASLSGEQRCSIQKFSSTDSSPSPLLLEAITALQSAALEGTDSTDSIGASLAAQLTLQSNSQEVASKVPASTPRRFGSGHHEESRQKIRMAEPPPTGEPGEKNFMARKKTAARMGSQSVLSPWQPGSLMPTLAPPPCSEGLPLIRSSALRGLASSLEAAECPSRSFQKSLRPIVLHKRTGQCLEL